MNDNDEPARQAANRTRDSDNIRFPGNRLADMSAVVVAGLDSGPVPSTAMWFDIRHIEWY